MAVVRILISMKEMMILNTVGRQMQQKILHGKSESGYNYCGVQHSNHVHY
jgi:hypothetical protein